jgi:hypothetical protein
MRKIFTAIAFAILLFSCKDNETKSLPQKKDTQNDSIKAAPSKKTVQSNSTELLELFSKNKEEVILKLKSLSGSEANELYEKYAAENGILLGKIDEKESNLLNIFYSEEEADKKSIKLLDEKLQQHQLEFEELGEGYVEITTKSDFYYMIFSKYVTSDYKDYLFLKSQENESPYSADAGLIITFKDLGDRIITWENFMTKYPDSKLIESVKEEYKRYQFDYLRGEDNTPTVENANEKYIYPENLQEFDRFTKKYPNSPTIRLINLFKANFKNENISDILTAEQDKL